MKPRRSPQAQLMLTLGAVAVVGAIMAGVFRAGTPRRSVKPLDIAKRGPNDVHGVYNLKGKDGELLLYNFRPVEKGVLYRGSGFVANKGKDIRDGGQTFQFLRSKGIRHVISLRKKDDPKKDPPIFYAEQGYLKYHSEKTGYRITIEQMPVPDAEPGKPAPAYKVSRNSALRASAEFIAKMKERGPKDGAVYIHCDAGKDRTGVVAAGYEMWRNAGTKDRDALWKQVTERFMVSNTLIARDPKASELAGGLNNCGDGTTGYVCQKWLEKLRPQLETVGQLETVAKRETPKF